MKYMNFKLPTLLFIACISVMLSSCLGIREERLYHNSPNNSNLRFNTDLNDLVFLGNITGTLTYSQYLGFITVYNNNSTKKTFLYANGFGLSSWSSRILYDNIGKYEDAELIMPIMVQENTQKMFLGSKVTVTIKAKVYKFK